MNWILSSGDNLSDFTRSGGGKATNLARLSQKDFPVPTWFCVSAESFDAFLKENSLENRLKPNGDFRKFSEEIEAAFLKSEIPAKLAEEIKGKLKELGLEDRFVAVRSSGLDEDSAENSFAGQFSSFLFQKGWPAISESLKRCWASGFSERALSYRVERGIGLQGIRIGVVIQDMVQAEAAGVVFSRHPIKVLDRDQILVSSVWGLGEGLVSGELESDDFEVSRSTGKTDARLAKKTHAMRQAPEGGLLKIQLPEEHKAKASLTDSQVKVIAEMSARLEEALGAPQDSEWCFENDRLFLVQTRPVTNLPPAAFYDEHINGKSPILWDNSNIIESYNGVTTPLTFSFANRAYTQVYIQFCEMMGVPQALVDANAKMFRNMLGLVRGRIYYNLVNWYKFILMLPGSSSNKGFMETMMGVKSQVRPEMTGIFDFVKDPPRYSVRSKVVLFAQTLWQFIRLDSIISGFQSHFKQVYEDARKKDLESKSLPELADHFHYLDDELLKQWKAPIINDYLCMLFFGLLKKLTEKWVAPDTANGAGGADSLQNDLLCGQGDLDSTEPTKCLMRIAAKVDSGEPRLRQWVLSTPAEKMWEHLRYAGKDSELGKDLFDFLDRFGFRCINELKLEEPDLHDDPSFVLGSIASYVRTKSYGLEKLEEREKLIRAQAEDKVRASLSGIRLVIYWWILKQARRAVKNRENLRFARTKIFGVCRHLFRAMGRKLKALGLLESEHDVFYLTVEEIVAFIEGRAIDRNLKALTQLRKTEYQDYRDTAAPPDRLLTLGAAGAWLGYPAALAESDLLRSEAADDGDPSLLRGTPCCPGVVEGVVRVVTDLKDAEGLNGEILVTGRTDPGWVPLYPSCSGLLIERGSLLSHSAVVARELGLPTIVGVSGGLLTRLKTGQRVRVDAGRGEIRILE